MNFHFSLHLNKCPYIMLCMFIMNVKEKTKLHLTESLQRRFKAIQHIVIFNHNALQKNQKSQPPPKISKSPKKPKTKSARILCYIAFTHLLGSLYSEFNLWLQLHSTQQQTPKFLLTHHKSALFAKRRSCT